MSLKSLVTCNRSLSLASHVITAGGSTITARTRACIGLLLLEIATLLFTACVAQRMCSYTQLDAR